MRRFTRKTWEFLPRETTLVPPRQVGPTLRFWRMVDFQLSLRRRAIAILRNIERVAVVLRDQEKEVRGVDLLGERLDGAVAHAAIHDGGMHGRWAVGRRGLREAGVLVLAGVGALRAEVVGEERPQPGLGNARVLAECAVIAGRCKVIGRALAAGCPWANSSAAGRPGSPLCRPSSGWRLGPSFPSS